MVINGLFQKARRQPPDRLSREQAQLVTALVGLTARFEAGHIGQAEFMEQESRLLRRLRACTPLARD